MPDIYLSDLRWCDWRELYRLASHPNFFYRALNDRNAWIPYRAARYIFKAKAVKHFKFMNRIAKAIRLKESEQLIGCAVLTDIDKPKEQAEIGIFIAAPYQGKGIGTTALRQFLIFCLEKFPTLQSVHSTVHPDNGASIKMQNHVGMKVVGRTSVKENAYRDRQGNPEPRLLMCATKEEIKHAIGLI